jgi:hypothetical protein
VTTVAWGAFVMAACGDDTQSGVTPAIERADGASQPPARGDLADAGDSRNDDATRDAGATTDAPTGTSNALSLDGDSASVARAVTDIAPTPAGGVIEDGTYVATEYVTYGRPAAVAPIPFIRSKLVISGGTWQSVTASASEDANAGKPETIQASTSGTNLSLTKVCPTAQTTETYGYTFTTNEAGTKQLRYFNGVAEVSALTFEKQ